MRGVWGSSSVEYLLRDTFSERIDRKVPPRRRNDVDDGRRTQSRKKTSKGGCQK